MSYEHNFHLIKDHLTGFISGLYQIYTSIYTKNQCFFLTPFLTGFIPVSYQIYTSDLYQKSAFFSGNFAL